MTRGVRAGHGDAGVRLREHEGASESEGIVE